MIRGDIFYADMGDSVGHEQGGKRPVLVLQNNRGNKYSHTTIVASITSADKKVLPTHVFVSANESGLYKDSIVMLEQIRTVDKRRLIALISHLSDVKLAQIDEALAISIGLKELP